MANLIQRLQNPTTQEAVLAGGENMIAIHKFTAAIVLYYNGEVTASQIENKFNLDSLAVVQLNAVLSKLDGLSTDIEKLQWLQKLESAGIYYEDGSISSTKYKEIMGF